MVREVGLVIQRLRVRISGPAGIEGGDCEWTALSPLSIPWLRCPWARHRTPICSPGAGAMAAHCSGCVFTVCVCVFTTHCCVCALGWVKCRGPISSMVHHTWQYITLLLFYYYKHHSNKHILSFCIFIFNIFYYIVIISHSNFSGCL